MCAAKEQPGKHGDRPGERKARHRDAIASSSSPGATHLDRPDARVAGMVVNESVVRRYWDFPGGHRRSVWRPLVGGDRRCRPRLFRHPSISRTRMRPSWPTLIEYSLSSPALRPRPVPGAPLSSAQLTSHRSRPWPRFMPGRSTLPASHQRQSPGSDRAKYLSGRRRPGPLTSSHLAACSTARDLACEDPKGELWNEGWVPWAPLTLLRSLFVPATRKGTARADASGVRAGLRPPSLLPVLGCAVPG